MKIRAATLEDIPGMIALERECATAAHWSEEQYGRLFEGEGGFVVVADAETDWDENPHFSRTERARNGAPEDQGPHSSGKGRGLNGAPENQNRAPDVIGFLVAGHVAGEWELLNVVVDAAARRIGLGMRLLEGLLSRAKQSGGEAVFLEVRESNLAARKLYEKAGFAQVGMRKNYYINPAEDAVLYRYTVV